MIVSVSGLRYEGSRAKFLSSDGQSKLLDKSAVVQQGDTREPYLFALVIDYRISIAVNGDEKFGYIP